jgi:ACS family pantothenate transporter-like MFS transporter
MGQPPVMSSSVEAAAVIIQSDEELKEKPKKWYYYLWDTLDKPKKERWCTYRLGTNCMQDTY